MGSTLKGKNLLLLEQILIFKVDSTEKGGKNENGKVVSPESVYTHLNPIALRMTKTP